MATNGTLAVLSAPNGLQLQVRLYSQPRGACGRWRTELVNLPNGTAHTEMRFPLYGARKLWAVCDREVTEVRVTLRDGS